MIKKYDVVTVGGAARDITFYTKEGKVIDNPGDPTRRKLLGFEYGAKINIEKANFTLGGGACNTAASFAKLGLKTAAVVRVGKDENGRAITEGLKKLKADTKFVQADEMAATGFSFIVAAEKTKEHIAFLHRGANNELRVKGEDLRAANPRWIYVSSLTGKNWQRSLSAICSSHATHNSPLKWAWNPGNVQLKSGKKGLGKFLKVADILILNRDEATELVLSADGNKLKKTGLEIEKLLETIRSWGPRTVVITCGVKGAYAHDGRKIYYSSIYKTKRADTTGAGDSFGSSFVAGLILYSGDIEKSMKLAMANSGSVVSRTGAQNGLLSRREAERRVSKMKDHVKSYEVTQGHIKRQRAT